MASVPFLYLLKTSENGKLTRNVLVILFAVLSSGVKKHYTSQTAITCSKLTTETLEQGVKYVQN